jgi:hypothetical protein
LAPREATLIKIILSFLLIVTFQQTNATHQQEQASLRALSGVFVLVEKIRAEMESDGLTHDQIQTDVELRIRKAGIRVLTQKDMLNTEDQPYLYINVQSIKNNSTRIYAYSLEVSLEQNVQLVRKTTSSNGTPFSACTWKRSQVGIIPVSQVRDVRDYIADYADQFINDFLAANQK